MGRPDPGHQDKAAESALEIERYTIAQIQEDERRGRPRDLFTIWFTSNLIPLAIVIGALASRRVKAEIALPVAASTG